MDSLFITCPGGFESILVRELKDLGISRADPAFCGVFIPKTLDNVFTVNYLSRVATRVLWPVSHFFCRGKEDLYRAAKQVPWNRFFTPEQTFAIGSNVSHPGLTNSMFASLVVKDAICDYFREKTGIRPSIHKLRPDVSIDLFIRKGKGSIYINTSKAPLHKRGWRDINTEATLHESLAAALLLKVGYTGEETFCDPFAGSGTFLVEAASIATNTPPGRLRKTWGFSILPEFDMQAWSAWKTVQDKKAVTLPKGKIFGSDKSRETADACKKNVEKAGFPSVAVGYDEIRYYTPPSPPDIILTNPPYGKRLDTSLSVFRDFSDFLETKCSSSTRAYFLYPEETLPKEAGLSIRPEFSFQTGGLPVYLFAIEKN